jgi:hypothetical protein
MDIPTNNWLSLLDLPNEILLIILKKLKMIDVLYSLVDVTPRFNGLVLNPLDVRTVNLTCLRVTPNDDWIYSIDDHVVERICQAVLPRINDHVKELIVDQHSLGRVLHATSYPQLESLALIDIDDRFYFKFMHGKSFLLRVKFTGEFNSCLSFVANGILLDYMKKQITCLIIDMNDETSDEATPEYLSLMFGVTLYVCHRLVKFHFCAYSHRAMRRIVPLSAWNPKSSTLTELNIIVQSFDDCLFLFDGNFPSLSTLILDVDEITETSRKEEKTEKLLKLKHFSLTAHARTFHYDDLIVPFLRRLINLEELTLYLSIIRIDSNHIDGVQLHDEILCSMPRLNKFIFSLETSIQKTREDIVLSSNEQIQRSFIQQGFKSVGSYLETFSPPPGTRGHVYSTPDHFSSRSHVYSLPYQFDRFSSVTNSIPTGIFHTVVFLLVTDVRPFEHEFFRIISQSFPLLKVLYVFNSEPQRSKQEPRTMITFPRLNYLHVRRAHLDYVEEFLSDQWCHSPCLFDLDIDYESLVSTTHHFTNDATRTSCCRLTRLRLGAFVPHEHFGRYFPSLRRSFS